MKGGPRKMEIKIPGSYAFSFCHNIVYIFLFFLYCSIWYPLIWPTDWFLGDKLLILTNTNYASVLQKRALRLIYFSKTREHAFPLSPAMLYFKTVSTLMHDISCKFSPPSICSFFTKTDEVHWHKTRSSNSGTFQQRINNFIDLFSFA